MKIQQLSLIVINLVTLSLILNACGNHSNESGSSQHSNTSENSPNGTLDKLPKLTPAYTEFGLGEVQSEILGNWSVKKITCLTNGTEFDLVSIPPFSSRLHFNGDNTGYLEVTHESENWRFINLTTKPTPGTLTTVTLTWPFRLNSQIYKGRTGFHSSFDLTSNKIANTFSHTSEVTFENTYKFSIHGGPAIYSKTDDSIYLNDSLGAHMFTGVQTLHDLDFLDLIHGTTYHLNTRTAAEAKIDPFITACRDADVSNGSQSFIRYQLVRAP